VGHLRHLVGHRRNGVGHRQRLKPEGDQPGLDGRPPGGRYPAKAARPGGSPSPGPSPRGEEMPWQSSRVVGSGSGIRHASLPATLHPND
jgi:hypothetical protein